MVRYGSVHECPVLCACSYRVILLDSPKHTERAVVKAITTVIPNTDEAQAKNAFATSKQIGMAVVTSCLKGEIMQHHVPKQPHIEPACAGGRLPYPFRLRMIRVLTAHMQMALPVLRPEPLLTSILCIPADVINCLPHVWFHTRCCCRNVPCPIITQTSAC